MFLAYLIPFGPTGDIYRIYSLHKYLNLSLKKSILINITDRFCSIFVTFFVGILMLFTFLILKKIPNYFLYQFIFWFVGILIFLAISSNYFLNFIKAYRHKFVVINLFLNFFLSRRSIFHNKIFLNGLFQLLFFGLGLYLVNVSLNGNLDLITWLYISPILIIIQSTPLFFTGWGMRELILLSFIHFEIISGLNDIIVSISFMIGIASMLGSLPGIYFYLKIKNFYKI